MRRPWSIYLVTMVLLGALLATSLVLKADGSGTVHPTVPTATQHVQGYVATHHDEPDGTSKAGQFH